MTKQKPDLSQVCKCIKKETLKNDIAQVFIPFALTLEV